MIETPTVFILGAGSSKPYGYPTGSDLRKKICNKDAFLSEFNNIINQRGSAYYNREKLRIDAENLQERFLKSSTQSIDLFLSRNENLKEIGKIAITTMVLRCELGSKFREDIEKPDQDWYSYLFHRMTSKITKSGEFQFQVQL
ncbi:hypothetical protein MUP95_08810 [bacterium]|nr:hypothetical protein [bacterium]